MTENILGINLPACQLQVAMGLPLHRIADIRKLYGRHIHGTDTIDFDYSERVVTPRHCIAVRVTAENPDAGFQPTSGRISELQFRSSIDVWGYFSVDNNGKIHEFADSQFGHIFASGRDREGARRAMIVALKELQIRGDIRTTIEYIIKMIQSDDFTNNKIDTMWLDHRIERSKELSTSDRLKYCPPSTLVALCGASLQSFRHFQQRGDEFISMLQVGQIPNRDVLSPQVDIDLIFDNVKYKTHCVLSGANTIIVDCNHDQQSVNIRSLSDGGYIFDISGKNHIAYINEESGGNLRMILDGHTCMFTPEYDPTRLTSSVAGKFARQLVDDGSHLNAGDVYVEIEVMKMYMPLKVPESGIIHFQMSEGAVLSPGDVIALMTLDYPDKVVTSEKFTGTLTVPSRVECSTSTLPHVSMRNALAELNKVLDGYYKPEVDIDAHVDTFLQGFDELLVPVYELEEAMSVLRGRIDATLFQKISDVNNNYKAIIEAVSNSDKNSILPSYPAVRILTYLHEYIQSQPADKRGPIITQTTPLWNVVEPYIYTTEVRQLVTFQQMIEKYLKVERLFDNMSFTDVVSGLRKDHSNNLATVLSLCRSHVNLTAKNQLILRVMEEMRSLPITTSTNIATNVTVNIPLRHELNTRGVKLVLKDLAKLRQPVYIHVSFTANLIVINQNNLRPETRRQRLHEVITSALTTGDAVGQGDRLIILKRFVDSNLAIKDLLIDALRQDKDYRVAIMELYLLKIYQATHNLDHMISGHSLKDDVISDISSWIKFDFFTKHIKAIENPSSNTSSASSTPAKRRFSSQGIADLTIITASPLYTPVNDPTALMSMSSKLNHPLVQGKRQGVMATIDSTSDLPRLFPLAIKKITPTHGGNVNAVHIILTKPITNCTDDEMAKVLQDFLSTQITLLHDHGIRRVTFLSIHPHDGDKDKKKVTQAGSTLVRVRRSLSFNSSVTSSLGGTISIFTYRRRTNYMEDSLFRHIEAPHAYHLDLPRLSNFDVSLESIPSTSGNVFLYRARPLDNPKGPIRFFARLVSYAIENNTSDAESLFVEALDILGIVIGREEAAGRRNSSTANHVFLNIVAPDNVVQLDFYHTEIRRICTKYWEKMVRLAINSVEVKLNGRLSIDATPLSLRLVASNPTGFVLKVDKYYEEIQGDDIVFRTLSTSPNGETVSAGLWDGLSIHTPYEVSQKFEKQRADAMASSDTLYVYDWPSLFESGVERLWFDYRNATPDKKKKHSSHRALATYLSVHEVEKEVFHCQELVLCDASTKEPLSRGWTAKDAQENGAIMLPAERPPGLNDAGMVAWLARLRTPECPEGRELVIISNDITFQAGSFGTKEDIIFYKVGTNTYA